MSGAYGTRATSIPGQVLGRTASLRVELIVLILLAVAVFGAINKDFLRLSNLSVVVTASAFVGIIAIGETILIIGGEFDLSAGSVAGLAAVVLGVLMTKHGAPVPAGLAPER